MIRTKPPGFDPAVSGLVGQRIDVGQALVAGDDGQLHVVARTELFKQLAAVLGDGLGIGTFGR